MLDSDWFMNIIRCIDTEKKGFFFPHYSFISLRQTISVTSKVYTAFIRF